MPDLSHLWQRFLLATSLVVGVVLGVAATVFGYSNLAAVDVRWSIFHLDGVPLWTVALVPLGIVLVAGTLYHWTDGLHHFSEHMRHRRRVHELEAEVASLKGHLDRVLDMPDHSTSSLPPRPASEPATPALPEPEPKPEPEALRAPHAEAPANGVRTAHHRAKRATLAVVAEPAAAAHSSPVVTNGGQETAATESAPEV